MAIANSDGSVIITTKIDVTPVSKALNALKSKFASLKEQRSAIQSLTTAIKDQRFVIKQLEIEYAMLVAQGKGNSTNAEELKAKIAQLKAELQQLTGAASSMGVKTAAASTKAAQGLKKFGTRIAGIIKSAVIFSLLYKVMQSVVKLFQNILMSDEEFRQDWEELKAAFYTAAYPIINLIVPAIKYIVQQVGDWAVSIGKVAAALQGISYSELVDQAKASKEAADNYADMEKSSKKTADNVKKQLASFDDIQILSSGNEEEQGTGAAGFEGLKEYDTSGEKSVLDDLMTAIGGALAAVGLILLFKGQIGWGLGFIVAGAAFWAISEIWGEDYDTSSVSQTINNIMQTLGVSLAAVGIILLLKGQVGWGIGFLIGGAAIWSISEIWGEDTDLSNASVVVENIMQTIGVSLAAVGLILLTKGIFTWGIGFIVAGAAIWSITEFATGEFSEEPIVNTLVKIMGIAGTALAALGIILLVFGQIPWGIAMLATGAVMLATALALNDEAIVEAIRGPLGVIMAIVGAALLVLGIILVCTGVGIPLGIALIAAGAASLVTVVAVNWDAIVDWVKGAVDAVIGWVETYGMLVLGIFLILTGVGIGFGIKVIWDWLSTSAENGNPTSKAIVDWIKGVWESVKSFWNEYIAPVFTSKFWLDLAKKCANGLIDGFESAINGIIGMFEKMINWIVDGLNKISFDVPDWVPLIGGKTFGFNIPRANFGRISIPRLAQGTVVPPNKEFMAVLGDNKKEHEIVSPVSTMKQAFMEAMVEMGGEGKNTREEHYYLNETELMSIVYKLFKGGERIHGESFVTGGTR